MQVVIALLRGVNVGGHNKINMDELRALFGPLGLRDAQTYVQSGNVVCRAQSLDISRLPARIEDAIERTFGFRPVVAVRTPADLKDVIARNPFAGRPGIEPAKLLVTFLGNEPGVEMRDKILKIKADPEELKLDGREIYIYFPNGMGRSKLPAALMDKILGKSGTARNWNTVIKLLEIAEGLETAG